MRWRTRLLFLGLVILLVILQYRLWLGYAEVRDLERRIAVQREQLEALLARNQALRAELESLRKGDEGIEARARKELGLIREGETYFQLITPERNGQ